MIALEPFADAEKHRADALGHFGVASRDCGASGFERVDPLEVGGAKLRGGVQRFLQGDFPRATRPSARLSHLRSALFANRFRPTLRDLRRNRDEIGFCPPAGSHAQPVGRLRPMLPIASGISSDCARTDRAKTTLGLADRCVSVKTSQHADEATSRDDRGSVTVEYTVILCLIAVGCALATAALGVPLVRMFATQRTWLLLPFP